MAYSAVTRIDGAQTVCIADIRVNGGTQSRANINRDAVADYAEAMEGGAQFPPVVLFYDGDAYWLADGFHRYEAYARAGVNDVPAEIRQGTQRDAILFSVGANAAHGLRRTNEDKRRAVMVLLNDLEWSKWSNREIARQCSVSEYLVRDARGPICDKIADSSRTVTRGGTTFQQETANIGVRQETAQRSEPAPVPICDFIADSSRTLEAEEPETTPADPERRKLEKLTTDALIDEVLGLRADLADAKAELAKMKAERDALKTQVAELSADDDNSVIRQLQAKLKNAENAKWRESEKTLAAQRQVYALKKELQAQRGTEIPL